MKTLAYLLITGCLGCFAQPIQPEPIKPLPAPSDLTLPSLNVMATESVVKTIHEMFGDSGKITISRPYPLSIKKDDTTVIFPTETDITFQLTDEGGSFVFAKPYPVAKVSTFGISLSPWLERITLNADDTATVEVQGTIYGKQKRTFPLGWEPESGFPAQPIEVPLPPADKIEAKPEVWYWGMEHCEPCKRFASDYETHKSDAPFTAVKKQSARPSWMTEDSPQFWWHRTKDQPSQTEVKQTVNKTGYTNWKDFISTWNKNRGEQSTQSSIREIRVLNSRSRANVSINGSHYPSRQTVLSHLLNDGPHRGKADSNWLNSLTTEQLYFEHDRQHGY